MLAQKSGATKRYQISDTNNFKLYKNYRLYISEPKKYFGVHLFTLLGMTYFYVFSFSVENTIKELNAIIIIAHIISFVFSVILGFKNPGILPKIASQFQSATKMQIPFDKELKPAYNQVPKQYFLTMKTHLIRVRQCDECLIFRPPRTVHCWQCNACFQRMDHHCPFIGNCVARGNYRYFFGYVLSLNVMILTMTFQLIYYLVEFIRKNNQFQKEVEFYLAIPLLLLSVVSQFFVGTLLSFHIFLILTGNTTNDYCKKSWNKIAGNPYAKNWCFKNLAKFIRGNSKNYSVHTGKELLERKKNESQYEISSQNYHSSGQSEKEISQSANKMRKESNTSKIDKV